MFFKKRQIKIALAFFLASQFFNLSLFFGPKQLGADLSTASDTLDDNRLSFVGALASGNSVGVSMITIDTNPSATYGWAMTDKNFNLFPEDTMMVGTRTNYEVDDIIDDATDNKIQLTTALQSGDADAGDPVIATRSATHTVSLTTVSAITDGAFRVRVKSGDANGIPDADGFDFSTASWDPGAGDVACTKSSGTGTYNFGMKTATASGETGCTAGYHCFECRYNGAGAVSDVISFTIGSTAKLINPQASAESDSRTVGSADTYAVIIEHMNPDNTVADDTTIKVAVVEAVRVTATVEPTIEFSIAAGAADSGTICGVTRTSGSVDTTAATVPLGTLSISSFVDAYQILTVSTNASGGYTVTVQEDDQLSIGGEGSTTIADSPGDTPAMTDDVKDEWHVTSNKGFAYSLENDDAASIEFQYSDDDGACTYNGADEYCAKQLPEVPSPDSSERIFYSATVADSENINFCYRAIIGATQTAGDYENRVTFIATATF